MKMHIGVDSTFGLDLQYLHDTRECPRYVASGKLLHGKEKLREWGCGLPSWYSRAMTIRSGKWITDRSSTGDAKADGKGKPNTN